MNAEACERGTLCELENVKILIEFTEGTWQNFAREVLRDSGQRLLGRTLAA